MRINRMVASRQMRRAPIGAPGYRAIILAHMVRKKLGAEGLFCIVVSWLWLRGLGFETNKL